MRSCRTLFKYEANDAEADARTDELHDDEHWRGFWSDASKRVTQRARDGYCRICN